MLRFPKHLGYVLAALAVVTFFGCDSQGSSDDDEPPEASGAQVVVAENDSLGSYLTDEDGFSLYLFTDGNGNPVPCTSDECVEAWPIFATEGEPSAGDGVDASLLSTTERSDGTVQVVYNDWPLYYFAGDEAPGDVNGQGIESFGGIWYLVAPSGEEVRAPADNDDTDDDDDGSGDPPY